MRFSSRVCGRVRSTPQAAGGPVREKPKGGGKLPLDVASCRLEDRQCGRALRTQAVDQRVTKRIGRAGGSSPGGRFLESKSPPRSKDPLCGTFRDEIVTCEHCRTGLCAIGAGCSQYDEVSP